MGCLLSPSTPLLFIYSFSFGVSVQITGEVFKNNSQKNIALPAQHFQW
jgi:hypothetical protein